MKIAVVKVILTLLVISIITACGYRPSAKFSRELLGQKISTEVKISREDPENTVLIKDAVDSAIVETLQSSLTTKNKSDSHLEISMANPVYSPIQYDSNGYVIAYRMTVTLKIIKYQDGKSKTYTSKGSYDFSVTPNAVITDQERFDAIKFGASKAISSFIAKLSAEGARYKRE
ncbi:MAG: LPS assembly lipoprotein LptE [Thiovulaceae bacterium]|nr:LPS assembly lipoprotein LptE [Sulfurimonadaceae bacterium]